MSDMSDKKKILVVDDNVDACNLTKMILEETGLYEVDTENQGPKTVETVRKFVPNLILLDIVMPDMGGPEVAVKLKEEPELSKIPIVFLTSLITSEEAKETPSIKGYPFISKPVDIGDLLSKVKEFLK